jgi:hypothetical protein
MGHIKKRLDSLYTNEVFIVLGKGHPYNPVSASKGKIDEREGADGVDYVSDGFVADSRLGAVQSSLQ